jgi:hypothetical protein
MSAGGNWMMNLSDAQEQNFKKEHMNPNEVRSVKVANFAVTLSGNYGDVLRAFENLKMYGRVFSIDQIITPAGGVGGTVFQNESVATTPIQVSGKIYYGLSDQYLSQDTLNKYFGKAASLGAAREVSETIMHRSDELSENPGAPPQPMPAISDDSKPAEGGAAAAPGKPGAAGTEKETVPGRPGAAGASSANAGRPGQLARNVNLHNRTVAVGG